MNGLEFLKSLPKKQLDILGISRKSLGNPNLYKWIGVCPATISRRILGKKNEFCNEDSAGCYDCSKALLAEDVPQEWIDRAALNRGEVPHG